METDINGPKEINNNLIK